MALTPDVAARLHRAGLDVIVESGAGDGASFHDEEYSRSRRAHPEHGRGLRAGGRRGGDPLPTDADRALIRAGQLLIGHARPAGPPRRDGSRIRR